MLANIVRTGAISMNIPLPSSADADFEEYYRLLKEANAYMNLARAIDDPKEAAEVHFLDSLAPLSVPGMFGGVKTLADVGAGAGFPGIVLSIALPEVRFTMIDSRGKRVKFLNDVIARLGLNAVAVHLRAEDAAKLPKFREAFDMVTARAVADLTRLSGWTLPLLRPGGRAIAYKGPAARDEVRDAAASLRKFGGEKTRILPVSIPNRPEWQHVLVETYKKGRPLDK